MVINMTMHDKEHTASHGNQQTLDPVCGMEVDPSAPAATLPYGGTTYIFCSTHCFEKFKSSPDSYTGASAVGSKLSIIQTGENDRTTNLFTCPMHPGIQQEGPGSCPKCGMSLEPLVAAIQAERFEYTCPMHPEIAQDKPGSCPKCGMALEPRTLAREEGGGLGFAAHLWLDRAAPGIAGCALGRLAIYCTWLAIPGKSQPQHVHLDRAGSWCRL